MNAGNPAIRYLYGFLPLELKAKPDFNGAIARRCHESNVLLRCLGHLGLSRVWLSGDLAATVLLVLLLLNDDHAGNHVVVALAVSLRRRVRLV